MIDWLNVGVTFTWILGLAALLATCSYAYWLRTFEQTSWGQVFATSFLRLSIALGLALVALGVLLSVGEWWERIAWAVVAVIAAWQTVRAWQARHAEAG